ncbi:response regulator transcription factor [Paraburkholderia aspalathi]|uniref:response regulator transcription factor n=1 Tax=Paraburkholderia aspalathi TaxID=1324617 RepID=UPI0038BA43BE
MRIAILMRDTSLFESIRRVFDEDGVFACHRFGDEASLLRFLTRQQAHLVVLDAGHEFTPRNVVLAWRNCHCLDALPVIVTGQFLGQTCMTGAFDEGADDILAGPPSPVELLVRAKQVLKRCTLDSKPANRIEFAPFTLDRAASIMLRCGHPIPLTSREFAIAWLFFSNPGKLLTRSQIAQTIWGKDPDIVGPTLQQHIYKLRCKLQLGDGTSSLQLSTVYSLGYKLDGALANVYDCNPTAAGRPFPAQGTECAKEAAWGTVTLSKVARAKS